MKKYVFIISILFFMLPCLVSAKTDIKGYITTSDVLFTSKPNITLDSCLVKVNGKASPDYGAPGKLHCLDSAEEVTILNYDSIIASTIDSCKAGYYSVSATVKSGTYNGYVCADYVQANIDTNKYKDEFTKAGFPESYFEKLTVLKDAHPNWIFTAYKTNLDWNEVVQMESIVGLSYIQVTDIKTGAKYLSLEQGSYDPITGQYLVREPNNWYAANSQTVAYYLDPRNFLVEKEIFMFENLGYNSSYQTLEAVQNVLKNTDLYDYANIYIDAATYDGNSINPVSLAASSKQEVVLGTGKLSGSADGTGKIGDVSYYNVYNIGAVSSSENPIMEAIKFAAGTSGYDRPWDTMEKAIKGGASWVANAFINKKQNTLYFKKFNVTSNSYGNYSHQYMTNIIAPLSEGISTYNAYSKIDGLLDGKIEFIIPVYENMPSEISTLPTSVDEEEKNKIDEESKKEEEENKSSIIDIVNNAGYKYNQDYISNIKIGTTAGAIIANLKSKEESVTVSISTTDASGNTKEISGSTILGTGDLINITSGEEKKSLRIIIYGDVNGDGNITPADYVKVKNYIMASGNLSGSYKLAADVTNDNAITPADYVNIKNYIMGNSSVLK